MGDEKLVLVRFCWADRSLLDDFVCLFKSQVISEVRGPLCSNYPSLDIQLSPYFKAFSFWPGDDKARVSLVSLFFLEFFWEGTHGSALSECLLNRFLLAKGYNNWEKLAVKFVREILKQVRLFDKGDGVVLVDLSKILRSERSLAEFVQCLFLLEDEARACFSDFFLTKLLRVDMNKLSKLVEDIPLPPFGISLSPRDVIWIAGLLEFTKDFGKFRLEEASRRNFVECYREEDLVKALMLYKGMFVHYEENDRLLFSGFPLLPLARFEGEEELRSLVNSPVEESSRVIASKYGNLVAEWFSNFSKCDQECFYFFEGFRRYSYRRQHLYKKLRKICLKKYNRDPLDKVNFLEKDKCYY